MGLFCRFLLMNTCAICLLVYITLDGKNTGQTWRGLGGDAQGLVVGATGKSGYKVVYLMTQHCKFICRSAQSIVPDPIHLIACLHIWRNQWWHNQLSSPDPPSQNQKLRSVSFLLIIIVCHFVSPGCSCIKVSLSCTSGLWQDGLTSMQSLLARG